MFRWIASHCFRWKPSGISWTFWQQGLAMQGKVILIILIFLSATRDPVTIFHLSGLDWKQHLWSRKSQWRGRKKRNLQRRRMRDQIFQTSRETLVLCYSIPLYSFEIFSFWSTEKIRVVLVDLIMIEAGTNKSDSQNIMRAHRLFISWLSRSSKITSRSRLSSCWVPACPWAGGRGSWDESSSPKESWRRVKAKTGRK